MQFLFMLMGVVLAACKTIGSQAPKANKVQVEGEVGAGQDLVGPNDQPWSHQRRQSASGFYFLVGTYKLLDGDLAESKQFYSISYDLEPNSYTAARLVAVESIASKDKLNLEDTRRMVLLYPRSVDLRMLYAQALLRSGDGVGAVSQLEIARKFEPTREDIHVALSETFLLQKNNTAALEALTLAYAQNPYSARIAVRLSRLYLLSGERKRALEPALRAKELSPGDPEVVLIFALVMDANERREEALQAYEDLYRDNAQNEELIVRMVELYRNLGDLKQSLDLLNDLSKLPGASKPAVELQRAIILWELKRFDESLEILQALLKENPQDTRIRYFSGILFEQQKKYELALEQYNAIPGDNKVYLSAQIRVAIVLNVLGRKSESLDKVKQLAAVPALDVDTMAVLANLWGELGEAKQVLQWLEGRIKETQGSAKLVFLLGAYREKTGDYEGAVAAMREVIKLDEDHASALNFLGYMLAERGQSLGEAESLIKRALALRPEDPYFMDSLGWVYYQKKDYVNARKILLDALAKAPDEGVIHEHLAEVYLQTQDCAKAVTHIEKAKQAKLEPRDEVRVTNRYEIILKQCMRKPTN